jgi:hypothetical protein
MKSQFEEAMSKRTTVELEKIINSSPGDYQEEAIEAAKNELQKRSLFKEGISKYTNEQLLEIINSESQFQSYKVDIANEEAEKRGLKEEEKRKTTQNRMNQELNKLQSEVSFDKYPALRFISGVFRLLAWIIAITALIAMIYLITQGDLGIVSALGVLVGGGILFIIHLAIAELIKVFIDIEYNTRIGAANHR